ncbi:fimbrillin family protein [Bacteroides reticulotermitis]|uniref:fimbrillin family protein n=1 Tax=Bacteroides reticulotermitis TaxID=1133319 RepID=UPI003A85CB12
MKKYIYHTTVMGIFGLLALSGCNNEVAAPDTELVPISFNTNLPTAAVASMTRATTFTNGDKVGIVAANVATESPLPAASGWLTSNLYLNHEVGTIGNATWEHGYLEYPISLSSVKYWPFEPNKYLGFVAYSPIPSVESRITRPTSDMNLTVQNGTAGSFFPDLLYTNVVGNYNKSRVSVLLDFKHAMAKLVVRVIAVDQDGNVLSSGHPVNQLRITSLIVNTKVTQGSFNLVSSQWTLTNPAGGAASQTAYTLVSPTGTPATIPYDNSTTSTSYLLPQTAGVNTVALSSLVFKVKDTSIDTEVGGEYTLDQFKQLDETPVTLEMGKTTVLLVKLQYTAIPPITPTIKIEGQLVEWDYKGTSTVVIE